MTDKKSRKEVNERKHRLTVQQGKKRCPNADGKDAVGNTQPNMEVLSWLS